MSLSSIQGQVPPLHVFSLKRGNPHILSRELDQAHFSVKANPISASFPHAAQSAHAMRFSVLHPSISVKHLRMCVRMHFMRVHKRSCVLLLL